MKTTSVLIHSLCVPCGNYCRYCLLSWNGKVEGADWDRSVDLAERFLNELREQQPEIKRGFSFGYSMEHPNLKGAVRTLRRLGGPTADFLQCDGMKMRNDTECIELMEMLHDEGIKQLNFTLYGLSDYHDRFAGRKGDFELNLRMMQAAKASQLPFTTGIPLTAENVHEVDDLVRILQDHGSEKVFLTIPHEEGRGKLLRDVRLGMEGFLELSEETQKLLNRTLYRTERDWLRDSEPIHDTHRTILIALRADNIDAYESRDVMSIIREIEALDENYYSSFPSFQELAEVYGDPNSEKLYRIRDLYYHYRAQYAQDYDIQVYDVTDERQSGSRRF